MRFRKMMTMLVATAMVAMMSAPAMAAENGLYDKYDFYDMDEARVQKYERIMADALRAYEKNPDCENPVYIGTYNLTEEEGTNASNYILKAVFVDSDHDDDVVITHAGSNYGKLYFKNTKNAKLHLDRKAEIDKICQEIVSKTEGMTDYEKAAYFYDYLEGYDYTAGIYDIYGLVQNGGGVCQTTANLFYKLCRMSGLDCRIDTSEKKPHSWNRIRIDGTIYLCDNTRDEDGRFITDLDRIHAYSPYEYR